MPSLNKTKLEPQDFILEQDKDLPENQQTVFRLVGLSSNDMTTLGDMVSMGKAVSGAVYAASRGIVGWKNLLENGVPVEFVGRLYPGDMDKRKRCTHQEIETLPLEWRLEIGAKVIELSQLTDTEKN